MPIEDNEFNKLYTKVEIIDTKLDTLLKAQEENYKDHENRIRTLEKAYWKLFGASAVISAVIAYLVKAF